jgi:phosphohistidine phosphatase
MKACLFRHGPAVERGTPGIGDDERPLTPEGRKRTRRAAKGVAKLDLGIDLVVSSPLPRALETAAILADVLGLPKPEVDERLHDARGGKDVIEVLKGLDAVCPVLVGHEPCLSQALSLLVAGSPGAEFALRKAGLAVLELVQAGARPRARLLQFLAPSVLRAL